MGALTFKNQAYQARPWELTTVEVQDYIDQQEKLTYHYRGQNLMRITSRGWLRDRVRFSYDGYRRQRLIQPLLAGQATGWARAYAEWFELVYQQRIFFKVDPCQPAAAWLLLLVGRLACLHPRGMIYAVDVNHRATIYQGSFGLQTVNQARLVLPMLLPHEEIDRQEQHLIGFQLFSLVFTQLLFKGSSKYIYRLELSPPVVNFQSSRYACFQVSPLQKFLTT